MQLGFKSLALPIAGLLMFAATQPHALAAPSALRPLDSLIVVEAESGTDGDGTPIVADKETRSKKVFSYSFEQSSGGAVITPVPFPYRIYQPFPQPVEAFTATTIPRAGRWYMHVRYSVTPEKIGTREYRKTTQISKHFHVFAPFQVEIAGKTFTAGADQSEGTLYRWDRFPVDLPAGKVQIKFSMPDMAAPDCVVLTQLAEYSPDIGDYSGPLWLRVKITKAPQTAFFLRATQRLNSYESKEPFDAGWLFKGKNVASSEEAAVLQKDPAQLLTLGEWSPWMKTVHARRPFTYAEIIAMAGDKSGRGNPRLRRRGLPGLELEYQAATRPDEKFLLRQGTEYTGDSQSIYILLPTSRDLSEMRAGVKSFSEWADERLKLATDLGLKRGEGPRKIRVSTSCNPLSTPRELEVFLETVSLVGMNGVRARMQAGDPAQLWDAIARKGFTWTISDHTAPTYQLQEWLNLPTSLAAAPGAKTWQEAIDNFWYDRSMKRAHHLWDKRPDVQRNMVKLANLVDEPGPAPSFMWSNCIPAIRGSFHNFLKAHNVKPEDLGKKSWDEVDLIGYQQRPRSGTISLLKRMNIDLEFTQPKGVVAHEDLIRYRKVPGKAGEPDRYRVQVPIIKGLRDASPEEKRHYYWTQRFRSYFTRHFYGQSARAVEELCRQGYFQPGIMTTPNFQAAPMMLTGMWDGALDLFEWAREDTSNTLMVEDWMNDHYRVGFGLALLDEARRKRGQQLAFLIVADRNFRRRYLMGLAQGATTFIDYVYGPLGTTGPAWASRPDGVRERAEMMRATRVVEDDLLATKLRPAQTAILVANSSEINAAYYNATAAETGLLGRAFEGRPLFRRAGIYSALLDAGIPAEIVSETTVLEDKALDRYKVLYVADTHVSRAAQQAIKEWVRRGGVLWADYAALARDENDATSSLFEEVFGLAERGALPPAAVAQERDTEIEAVNGEADETTPEAAQEEAQPAISKMPEQISVSGESGLEAVTFAGSLYRPHWKLSTGKALATFQDGSPALVLNRFGNGQAILFGSSALAISPYSQFMVSNSPESNKARRITELAPHLAGIELPCRVSTPRINSIVRDGENQTVLFLINSTGAAQKNVRISLTVPRRVQRAFDQKNRAVTFQQKGDVVEFARDIDADTGEIVVFK